MNLRAIYDKINCLCAALFAPLQLASRTLVSGDGNITIGSMTGNLVAKSLVFHLPAGQQIQLTDQTAMTTAVFDNTDGAGAVTLTFDPGLGIPAEWTLTATTASSAQISVFY